MLKKLAKFSEKILAINNWWTYKMDEYQLPNGKTGEYHYVHTAGSTFIIPEISTDKFVLTKQYRYLNSRVSIEFPGGGLKEGVDPEFNAKNELEEEAGLTGDLKLIGSFNPYNGVTDEICQVFYSDRLIRTKPRPEDSEEFIIIELNSSEIENLIESGEIWDGMTLAAWSIYKAKRKLK